MTELWTATPLVAGELANRRTSSGGLASVVVRRTRRGWVIEHNGTIAILRAGRGMQQLITLVSTPRTEVHALELANPSGTTQHTTNSAAVLDANAKNAFRRRLMDLRENLAEAEKFNDIERAARAHTEIDVLTTALSRAIGLGGRDRRLGSNTEQARINVTRALRRAISHVADTHPHLGTHLDRSIRTGTYCVYNPAPNEPNLRWQIRKPDPHQLPRSAGSVGGSQRVTWPRHG